MNVLALIQRRQAWQQVTKQFRHHLTTGALVALGLVAPVVCPVAMANEVLGFGDFGDPVAEIQQALSSQGYYFGTVDGDFGSGTEQAVIEFQQSNGLFADGVVGSETSRLLFRVGEESTANRICLEDPIETQQLLSSLRFYFSAVDGVCGPLTQAAILEAQRSYGLFPDGVAGPQTLAVLRSQAAPTPVPTPTPAPIPAPVPEPSTGTPGSSAAVDVAELQQLLQARGYYLGFADGVYGPATEAAVRNAQFFYGLTVDGIAGPRTLEALRTRPRPDLDSP